MEVPVKYIALKRNLEFFKQRKALETKFLEDFKKSNPAVQKAIDEVRANGLTEDPDLIVKRCMNPSAGSALPPLKPKPGVKTYAELSDEETRKQKQINVLHGLKMDRQLQWLQTLEKFTYDKLKEVIVQYCPYEINDPAKDVPLYMIALPEFYYADINDDHKHQTTEAIKNYSKPIYYEHIKKLVMGQINLQYSVANLSGQKNIIIFGGTILWKQINPTDHKKEKIVNSLLVYWCGACQIVWNKRFVSKIDGLGEGRTGKGEKKIEPPDVSTMILPPQSDETRVPELLPGNVVPRFRTRWRSTRLKKEVFIETGFDICLDYSKKVLKTMSDFLAWQAPHIHVLIAGGMKSDRSDKFATKLFLRCDAGGRAESPRGDTECQVYRQDAPPGEDHWKVVAPRLVLQYFEVYEVKIDIEESL